MLAIDIGGTNLKAALFDSTGRMLGLTRTPTPQAGRQTASAIMDRITEIAATLRRDFPAVTTRAAGLAEFTLRATAPYIDVVVAVIGTGVSAAVILGGRMHLGGGFAGELVHAIIDPLGEPCPFGSRGCLETLACAASVVI